MEPPETSGSTSARTEHPNADETEKKKNLKNNFTKMKDALKEEMRNFLKEVEEKTN